MKASSGKTIDMTQGSPFRHILSFMLPTMVGYLFQQFYSMADTVIIGRYLGEDALAAPLVALLGSVTASFGFAAIVRVSYPIVSYLGLAATLFAVGLSAVAFFKRCGFGKFFRPKKLVEGLTAKRK